MKNDKAKQNGMKVLILAGFETVSDDGKKPSRVLEGVRLSARPTNWEMANDKTGITVRRSGYKPRMVTLRVDKLPPDEAGDNPSPYPFMAYVPPHCEPDGGKDGGLVFDGVALGDIFAEPRLK